MEEDRIPVEQVIEIVMMEDGNQIATDAPQFVSIPWSDETSRAVSVVENENKASTLVPTDGQTHYVPESQMKDYLSKLQVDGTMSIDGFNNHVQVITETGGIAQNSDNTASLAMMQGSTTQISEILSKSPAAATELLQAKDSGAQKVVVISYDDIKGIQNVKGKKIVHPSNTKSAIQSNTIESKHNNLPDKTGVVNKQDIQRCQLTHHASNKKCSQNDSPALKTVQDTQASVDSQDGPKKIMMFKWGTKEKRFRCQICDMSFSTGDLLKEHFDKHDQSKVHTKPFPCNFCTKSFGTLPSLQNHQSRKHSGIPSQKCKYCNKVYANIENLEKHMKSHGDLLVCPFPDCDQNFAYRSLLNTHMLKHAPVHEKFKCEVCERSFSRKDILQRHLLTHDDNLEKRYKCVECGKGFMYMFVLRRHMRSIHSNEPDGRVCEICGTFIRNKENYKRHLKVHSDDRDYQCDRCTLSFKQKQHLIDHMNIHSSELKFKCNQCDVAFKHKRSLNRHLLYHAKNGNTALKIKCELCLKNFIDKRSLNSHIKSEHTDMIICNICDKIIEQNKITEHLEFHEKGGENLHGQKTYRVYANKCTNTGSTESVSKMITNPFTVYSVSRDEKSIVEALMQASSSYIKEGLNAENTENFSINEVSNDLLSSTCYSDMQGESNTSDNQLNINSNDASTFDKSMTKSSCLYRSESCNTFNKIAKQDGDSEHGSESVNSMRALPVISAGLEDEANVTSAMHENNIIVYSVNNVEEGFDSVNGTNVEYHVLNEKGDVIYQYVKTGVKDDKSEQGIEVNADADSQSDLTGVHILSYTGTPIVENSLGDQSAGVGVMENEISQNKIEHSLDYQMDKTGTRTVDQLGISVNRKGYHEQTNKETISETRQNNMVKEESQCAFQEKDIATYSYNTAGDDSTNVNLPNKQNTEMLVCEDTLTQPVERHVSTPLAQDETSRNRLLQTLIDYAESIKDGSK